MGLDWSTSKFTNPLEEALEACNILLASSTPSTKEKKREYLERFLVSNQTPLTSRQLERLDRLFAYEKRLLASPPPRQVFKPYQPGIYNIQEDILEIAVDAIVNPANDIGLGCFRFDCRCLDRQIHRRAGPRLREECRDILGGRRLATGQAFLTSAHQLDNCNYILHTKGPIYSEDKNPDSLATCYTSCLDLALEQNISVIAFPEISTGLYRWPVEVARPVAKKAVEKWVEDNQARGSKQMCILLVEWKKQ